MTKPRAPLSYDNALAKIAGAIGWARMAEIAQQPERTVRDWGDPDTGRGCPIGAAEKFDLAFQAAGGEGAPIFETFALRLEQARADRFADQVALARRACVMIREGAEAEEALILASLPGSTIADRRTALRELEDFIAAAKAVLPLLSIEEPPPP